MIVFASDGLSSGRRVFLSPRKSLAGALKPEGDFAELSVHQNLDGAQVDGDTLFRLDSTPLGGTGVVFGFSQARLSVP
jgi:hypothetical protein